MNVNFKLLVTFLSVARNASFRKAAEDTNRSLPAVSMQIKQLEEQLGVALFQRTTRKVHLTREGEQLMGSVLKALAELETGLLQIRKAVDVQEGRLAFACVPTVASTRLPAMLTTFARRYPGISVHVRELASQDLLEAVRKHEVDFGIGPIVERRNEFEFLPLFVDEYCALLPPGYKDRERASVSLRELSKMPLLMLSSATAFREHLDRVMRESGLTLQTNYEFMQVTTLMAMVRAGLGAALLPRVAIPVDAPLKVVRISSPSLQRTIAVVTLRGHSLSPAAARLVALCEQMIPPDSRPQPDGR